jgi:hypothetical protein
MLELDRCDQARPLRIGSNRYTLVLLQHVLKQLSHRLQGQGQQELQRCAFLVSVPSCKPSFKLTALTRVIAWLEGYLLSEGGLTLGEMSVFTKIQA